MDWLDVGYLCMYVYTTHKHTYMYTCMYTRDCVRYTHLKFSTRSNHQLTRLFRWCVSYFFCSVAFRLVRKTSSWHLFEGVCAKDRVQ